MRPVSRNNSGITYKYVLRHIISTIQTKIEEKLQQKINDLKDLNIQILVIGLLLLTLTIGVIWIFILIKDESDVALVKISSGI